MERHAQQQPSFGAAHRKQQQESRHRIVIQLPTWKGIPHYARLVADALLRYYSKQGKGTCPYNQMRHYYQREVRYWLDVLPTPLRDRSTLASKVLQYAEQDGYVQCTLAALDPLVTKIDAIVVDCLDKLQGSGNNRFMELLRHVTMQMDKSVECSTSHSYKQHSSAKTNNNHSAWKQTFTFPKVTVDEAGFQHVNASSAKKHYTFPSAACYVIFRHLLQCRWHTIAGLPLEMTKCDTGLLSKNIREWTIYVLDELEDVSDIEPIDEWLLRRQSNNRLPGHYDNGVLCNATIAIGSSSSMTQSPLPGDNVAELHTQPNDGEDDDDDEADGMDEEDVCGCSDSESTASTTTDVSDSADDTPSIDEMMMINEVAATQRAGNVVCVEQAIHTQPKLTSARSTRRRDDMTSQPHAMSNKQHHAPHSVRNSTSAASSSGSRMPLLSSSSSSSTDPIHVLAEFDELVKQFVVYEPGNQTCRHYAPQLDVLIHELPNLVQQWRHLDAPPTVKIIVHVTAMRYEIYPDNVAV